MAKTTKKNVTELLYKPWYRYDELNQSFENKGVLNRNSNDETWYVLRVVQIWATQEGQKEQLFITEMSQGEMTTQYLPENLVCDRIFQDKDNDCTWCQKESGSIFCCHQERVSVFMPPHYDTLQHSISHAMSPLICAFAPKKTPHSRKFGND